MDRHHSDRQRGFTLIEVTMAMIFVAFIIFILAAVTVNIIRSYNRGVWLSRINLAGQQLNMDIGEKVRYSTAAMVDENNRRLCVGGVSYLWNTEADIDKNVANLNRLNNGQVFSLARIDDSNAEYCSNPSKMPPANDDGTRVLLSRGATIQEFNVTQGVDDDQDIPLLTLNTVISTEGSNRPIRAYEQDGQTKIDANGDRANSRWQCGDWYDDNNNGVVDNDDHFEPGGNQYCSFAEYNITVYERSRQR